MMETRTISLNMREMLLQQLLAKLHLKVLMSERSSTATVMMNLNLILTPVPAAMSVIWLTVAATVIIQNHCQITAKTIDDTLLSMSLHHSAVARALHPTRFDPVSEQMMTSRCEARARTREERKRQRLDLSILQKL
jgi:hypothetical protein